MAEEAFKFAGEWRPPRDARFRAGVCWSLASALLWATTFVTGRYLLADSPRIDPMTLSAIRFALGSVVLAGAGLCLRGWESLCVPLKELPRLAGLGFFGMVGMSVLLFWGQRTTTAINASLVMQICPVLILIAGTFIGERVGVKDVLGILLSLAGCLLVVEVVAVIQDDNLQSRHLRVNLRSGHLWGDLAVFLSACAWTVYSVWGKPVVAKVGGFTATLWCMVFGAVELILLRLVLPLDYVKPTGGATWLAVLYLAVFPTAVAFFAWYEAMDRIELSLLNVMQYLTPVATVFLAWVLLHERLTGTQWLGIALVLAGVAVTGMRRASGGPVWPGGKRAPGAKQ